jgi:potassium efflux system protein
MTVAIFECRLARHWLARLWLLMVCGSVAIAPLLDAQIPGLNSKPAAFAQVSDPDADAALPEGVDAAAFADHRRDLEQIIASLSRYRGVVEGAPEAQKALAEAHAATAAWNGFAEKPPYSILMLDELLNQKDALSEKAASNRSSLVVFSRTLDGIQDEARQAEEASRRMVSAAAESSADGAAKWRLEADRTKSRLRAVRAMFLQSTIALLKDQLETAEVQLSLLERQIATARKNVRFSDEDLAVVKKAAADRQSALRKELATIRKQEVESTAAKNRMQVVKDKLLKETPAGTPLEETPELALATVKMEASETRVNSLQYVAGTLEILEELEAEGVETYENRKALFEAGTRAEREAALQLLRSAYDRVNARGIVFSNELAAVNADIGRQEARASARPADDPRLIPLNDVRTSLWNKQAIIQRAVQATATQNRMLKRWLDEFEESNSHQPLTERFSEGIAAAWTRIRDIWSIDVFTYDDTVMISGVATTQERGVSLGKLFAALTGFLVAYLIARKIKNRLSSTVVRRGHLAEAQARTLSNWLMIVVSLGLALGTLHFLKIPLTVFAFFGGALAIGLGFGTQTLIKNFISGIIVLFERKIRVGDIVDVGGISGSITEINTRSSVLKSGDGKETLVPNSLFLENRVTNLTLSNRRVRRKILVRVALSSPVQTVTAILKEAVERHGLVLKEPAPIITFEDFADNGHLFAIYYWTEFNDKTNGDVVASDIRFMVEKRFSEMGIQFPGERNEYPIRTNQPLQLEWVKKSTEPGT